MGHVLISFIHYAGLLTLGNLKRLDLGSATRTSFCSLPAALSQLSALTRLSLQRYCDHVHKHALLHLTALKLLSLAENPTEATAGVAWLYNLPRSLKGLEVISREYELGGPALRQMIQDPDNHRTAPCVRHLSQLTYLSFSTIKGMRAAGWQEPGMLVRVTNLCVLDLYGCRIRQVPEAILNLSTLQWLALELNTLKILPVAPYLHNLKSLSLASNRFSKLPFQALNAATALTCLSLEDNYLRWTVEERAAVAHIREVNA
jgi:Leucine-rich repeat (LRR) protein